MPCTLPILSSRQHTLLTKLGSALRTREKQKDSGCTLDSNSSPQNQTKKQKTQTDTFSRNSPTFWSAHECTYPQRLCVGCVRALDIRTRLSRPLQIESTQAESQWIVGQAYSQHLQYLEAIKSSAKDLSLPIFEIAIDLTVRMKLGRSL